MSLGYRVHYPCCRASDATQTLRRAAETAKQTASQAAEELRNSQVSFQAGDAGSSSFASDCLGPGQRFCGSSTCQQAPWWRFPGGHGLPAAPNSLQKSSPAHSRSIAPPSKPVVGGHPSLNCRQPSQRPAQTPTQQLQGTRPALPAAALRVLAPSQHKGHRPVALRHQATSRGSGQSSSRPALLGLEPSKGPSSRQQQRGEA